MSIYPSAAPFSIQNSVATSAWGNYFLSYASNDMKMDRVTEERYEELKEEVRKMVVDATGNPEQLLILIDAIQRLGVSYHFESEIEAALQPLLADDCYRVDKNEDNLYLETLRFRLLRQQGHNVSCGIFSKYKDAEGKFKESLISDTRGMLSLYETTHLRVHGEDILEEALAFTTIHLKSMVHNLRNTLSPQVVHALNQPIRKSLTRVEARRYISTYQEEDKNYNELLLEFAKLDFNLLQKFQQKELSDLTRWWKDLNFVEKLPFARDRLVECYFWILGVYFEPKYFLARRMLTKVITIASIIDDIYDVRGTFEELILFTDAVERWDIKVIDTLPEYMRLCYGALLDVYTQMEEELIADGRSYRVHYAKASMKRLVRAYFDEAKWIHEVYVPTMDEYMQVALVSSGYIMLATTSFVGMPEVVTMDDFDWVSNDPLIVRASTVICRLMNDMVEHEKEGIPSAVECYIKQHGGSKQEVLAEFHKRVINAWKDMNQECLHPTEVSMPLLERILNLTRVINILYKDEDGYTYSKTWVKNVISSLLIDSVST